MTSISSSPLRMKQIIQYRFLTQDFTPNQHTTDMQEGLIQNGMLGESREVSDVEADRVTTQQRDDSPTRNGMPGGTGELASLEETQQIATHEGEIASQEDLLDEAGEFTRINTGAHITPSNRDSLIRNGMPDETLETTTDEEERRLTFVAFPLIPQVTNSIIKLFRSDKLKIAVKNEFKIGNMFSHTKDKFSIEKTSNAVYKVPCAQCHLSYIGQTSQQIKKRMAQHKSDIKHPGKGCALAQHCHDNQHMMNFNNIQILEREKNYRKRTFLEMFHIKKNLENVVNSRSDIKNISSIYTFLIHHNKDHDRRRNNSTA
ncbi:uncharacterized protein LOC123311526 isoform X2 [Coccinella septempunctata]|uniref:uncharacterized protein LOC123311526 isoform X2 n=1 Tax=Coccinella septempunctata TaxID=41139 RepID=UPI001D05D63B|nr:uncharacterized protein LOC123311526 isoform X2 [Coccinella septempunctata]